MRAFGAELEVLPSEGGKVTPGLFDRFKARIAVLKDEPDTFWTDQFHNADALDGYRQIGTELAEQVGTIDAFCGATGTAGMLVGVSRALKAAGYVVDVAADGEEAWFLGDTEDYGAVVLDLGLPRMDGIAVLKLYDPKEHV